MNIKLLAVIIALTPARPAFCGAPEYGKFITDGPPGKRMIALTFDDGPGENTPDLLRLLSRHKAKATFFMLGVAAKTFPATVKEVGKEGHLIGNHTYSHANFNKVDENKRQEKLKKEIEETAAIIKNETGLEPHYLRIPYGVTKQWILALAKKEKYVVVNWTHGSDWHSRPKEELLKEYLQRLKPGAIFLLHDGGSKREVMLYLVDNILAEAEKRNLRPVRLDKLLETPDTASPAK